MSNARYFADGTDFYRVVYGSGSIDGPYVRFHAAKRVGNSGIKVRQRYSHAGTLLHEWQTETEFKIQKLMPTREECGCCLTLEWQDVTE